MWWAWVAVVYGATVLFAAGVVWADERRSADWPQGVGDWVLWAGSFVLVAAYWPLIMVLRRTSRPAPRPQPGRKS